MIPTINVYIIDKGKEERHSFRLPDVSADTFGEVKDGMLYRWDRDKDTADGDRIWIWTTYQLSDEEEAKLQAEGKAGTISAKL
jgi:hypothetical protein